MIARKEFNKGNFERRVYLNREDHPISVLLKKYGGFALSVKEISKRTKIKDNTIRSMLRHLIKDGLVVHKTPYFAWKKK